MRMTPRVTLILKRASSKTRRHRTLAKKIATTWRQEFTKKSLIAPLVHLQESRKRTAPQVNRNSARKTPLRRLRQTKFCWRFSSWQTTTIPANFQNNINRISKLPKSHTTTILTFDGKSEKFELFEDLLQASLKIHNNLTEEDRINYFHSLMKRDALQTFKNINGPTRENLREVLAVFRKYVKP